MLLRFRPHAIPHILSLIPKTFRSNFKPTTHEPQRISTALLNSDNLQWFWAAPLPRIIGIKPSSALKLSV